jgi:hypothetical protein
LISAGVLTLIFLILIAIFVLVSYRDVAHDEFGVEYHEIEKRVSQTVLDEGRYFRTPSTKIFRFKRTVQTLTYKVEDGQRVVCLSEDGIRMSLDIIVQYQIRKSDVLKVFYEFGSEEAWKEFLRNVMTESIFHACSTMTAQFFYDNRTAVGENILASGQNWFDTAKAYADVVAVDLVRNRHDEEYLLAHRQLEEALQEQQRLLIQRAQTLTDMETLRQNTLTDNQIAMARALGESEAIINSANTTAEIEIERWRQRGLALLDVKIDLGNVSNAELIDQYVRHISMLELYSPVITLSN